MNLEDAQREYDAAMANMEQARLRLEVATDELTRVAFTSMKAEQSKRYGAHLGTGTVVNTMSVQNGEVIVDGETYTGRVNIDSTGTHISGQIVRNGNPHRCVVCQGTNGWTIRNDNTWHSCGAQQ
jgi:hypothetical protein